MDKLSRYLAVGRVVGAHGLRGEVKVEVHTDFPERFLPNRVVYLGTGDDARPTAILGSRYHKGHVLLLLEHCADRTAAQGLLGQWLSIPAAEAAPLDDDEFYEHDVLGAVVRTEDGEVLGQVHEVLFTGANEVFVVRGEAAELLIPVLKHVVLEIDRAGGSILVALPPGLRDA